MMNQARALQHLMRWYWRRLPPRLFFVSDNAGWSFDWDIHYIRKYLKRQRIPAQLLASPEGIRGHVVHFWDRYDFLQQDVRVLAQHNRLLLTWFHGSPNDPAMQPLFDQLQPRIALIENIITSNQTSRRHLIAAHIPDEKIRVIPLGVDLTHFKPPLPQERAAMRAKLAIPDAAFCIGSFQKDGSGWGDGSEAKLIKGPDIFLEVIACLRQQKIPLFVILTGPARGYVKNGLEKLGVPYRHHFVADYLALRSYYHALDAYIITSRDEGGPKGLMESWATGVPVVSTNMGMPADWIEHGSNGLLAEVEAVDKLASHLQQLYQNPHLQSRLMLGGLQSVKPLDWAAIVAAYYVPLYQPLLRHKSA